MESSKLGIANLIGDMISDGAPSHYIDAHTSVTMTRGEFETRLIERNITHRELMQSQYSGNAEDASAVLADLGVIQIQY